MSKTNDGGPAFSVQESMVSHGSDGVPAAAGMSLRDWFAGQALSGIAACPDQRVWKSDSGVKLEEWLKQTKDDDARTAYELADAMLAAREAKP